MFLWKVLNQTLILIGMRIKMTKTTRPTITLMLSRNSAKVYEESKKGVFALYLLISNI